MSTQKAPHPWRRPVGMGALLVPLLGTWVAQVIRGSLTLQDLWRGAVWFGQMGVFYKAVLAAVLTFAGAYLWSERGRRHKTIAFLLSQYEDERRGQTPDKEILRDLLGSARVMHDHDDLPERPMTKATAVDAGTGEHAEGAPNDADAGDPDTDEEVISLMGQLVNRLLHRGEKSA